MREEVDTALRLDVTRAFVLCDAERAILGYYTLSATSISRDGLPKDARKDLPRFRAGLPAFLIGKLAVHHAHQRTGIGEYLLMEAQYRAIAVLESVGAVAIVVDTVTERAQHFYRAYNFQACIDRPQRLFKPMQTVLSDFEDAENDT